MFCSYTLKNPTHILIKSLEKNLLKENNIKIRDGWDINKLPDSIIMALYEYCLDGEVIGYKDWKDTPIYYYFEDIKNVSK